MGPERETPAPPTARGTPHITRERTPVEASAVPSSYRPQPPWRRALRVTLRPLRSLGQGLRALGWSAWSALRASLTPFRVLARYDAPLVEGDAERVLERAVRIATRAGAPRVTADHLWASLLEEEPTRRALCLVGVDPRHMQRALELSPAGDDAEDEGDGVSDEGAPAILGGEVKDLVGHAVSHAFQAERAHVLAGDLVVALLDEGEGRAAQWLRERGVAKADLVAAVAHGRDALREPRLEEGAEAEVILYDDEYTSRSLVFDALRTAFGMSRGEAQRSLVQLDARGSVSLGVLPVAEALAKARALNEYARSQGSPLLARAMPAAPDDGRDAPQPR